MRPARAAAAKRRFCLHPDVAGVGGCDLISLLDVIREAKRLYRGGNWYAANRFVSRRLRACRRARRTGGVVRVEPPGARRRQHAAAAPSPRARAWQAPVRGETRGARAQGG